MENDRVAVGIELVAIALEKLVLELDPMQTDRVQEALQQVHAHEHAERDGPQHGPEDDSLSKNKIRFSCENFLLTMTIVTGRLSYPKTNGPNMRFMNVSASC